jgi:hypothetical protein
MPDPQTREAEAVSVQLTRMEGTVNGIDYKVGDLIHRMVKVEDRTSALESATQTLREDARAKEAKDVALALALREADETRRNKDHQEWSPFAKTVTVIVALTSILTVAILIYARIHH